MAAIHADQRRLLQVRVVGRRPIRAHVGERAPLLVGLAGLAFVVAGFFAYPTLPTYDSMWALVWAQELLDGRLPSFDAYRAPTEHPLGVLVSVVIAPLGDALAPRAFVAITLLSFAALLAGLVRLGALTLGLLAGLIAALLLLTRLNFAYLAAFGYFDIPFLALLVWAAAIAAKDERQPPRPRSLAWALLIAAGLLRPEAWAFALLYGAWVWRGATAAQRLWAVAAVAAAPVAWAAIDLVVTGDPMFSLTYTTDHAAALGRDKGLLELPGATFSAAAEFVKPPVLAAACIGIALALWCGTRRAALPLALVVAGVLTFLIVSQQGFSVIPRYFALAAVGLFLFAGYALGGWELLARGSSARRWWIAAAFPAAVAGIAVALVTLNPAKVGAELRLRERVFGDLDALLDSPAVRAGRRCGPLSLPNHKLAPYVRWRLHASEDEVIARSNARALSRAQRGVAMEVRDVSHLLTHQAFGPKSNSRDPPTIGPAPAGFRRVATRDTLIASVRC